MSTGAVIAGVLANLLTAAMLFILGWLIVRGSRRRRLARFFHLADRGITLYTSTLQVVAFGAAGVDGRPRSFSGPAIPGAEARVIAAFQRAFGSISPGPLTTSGPLKYLRLVDIDSAVEASPDSMDAVTRDRTFVTLGSPAFNSASVLVERQFAPSGRFSEGFGALDVPGGPDTDAACGLAVRTSHPATGQVAFYAAGPSEAATVAAAYFLLEHWQELDRRYRKGQPFCVVVRATSSDGRGYEVIFETSG